MESLPLHPKLVHLPLGLAALMPFFAAILLLCWWRQWLPRRAWLLVPLLQLSLFVSGYFAMEAGEDEEELVERVVAEQYIEDHEEAAELFVWSSTGVLILMVVAALLPRDRGALAVATAATLASGVVLALAVRAGDAGGRLVYEHGAARAYSSGTIVPALPRPPPAEHEHEHEHEHQ